MSALFVFVDVFTRHMAWPWMRANDLCESFDLDDQLRTWTDEDTICSVEDEVLLLSESKVSYILCRVEKF